MNDAPIIIDEPPLRAAGDAKLVFRGSRNWTAALFFTGLSLLHLFNCASAFSHGRIEGYMSLMLCVAFAGAAALGYLCRFELAVLPDTRRLRLRSGFRRCTFERFIPFSDVQGVRLTTCSRHDRPRWQIELLCDGEDIDCPAGPVPHQQALCLALTMGVRLIKVSQGPGAPSDRLGSIDHLQS